MTTKTTKSIILATLIIFSKNLKRHTTRHINHRFWTVVGDKEYAGLAVDTQTSIE
jgi:hypothetical protein